MHLKSGNIFLTLIITFTSCNGVKRTPEKVMDYSDRSLSLEFNYNIFDDYLWATPPLYAKNVVFSKESLKLPYAGDTLKFIQLHSGLIMMEENGYSYITSAVLSNGNCYYNLDILSYKTVMRQRYVSKTIWETKSVPVTKTKNVNEKVTVTKTRTVYNSSTKSSKSESYTTTETHHHAKNYTTYENRTVSRKVWEWKSVPEKVLDIPNYTVYKFIRQNKDQVMLYDLFDGTNHEFYFQHISYYLANDDPSQTSEDKIPAHIVLLDGNQDGYFDGPSDYAFYAMMNPYKYSQRIPDIYNIIDNQWFVLQNLKTESLLSYKIDDSAKYLKITNVNTPFLNSSSNGRVIITNLPVSCKLEINGTHYLFNDQGELNKKIQFGYYKAIISFNGHYNQVLYFSIDKEHPVFRAKYQEQPISATIELTNHAFRNWILTAINDTGKEWITSNNNSLSIPGGIYKFVISGGGNSFYKEATVKEGELWIYNFSLDTLTKQ